jgi:hypothetical protein
MTNEARTGIPAPEMCASDAGPKNPFGTPFIVMQAINGRQIGRRDPLLHHPGYLPGSITFEEIGRMWRDLDRMQALILR